MALSFLISLDHRWWCIILSQPWRISTEFLVLEIGPLMLLSAMRFTGAYHKEPCQSSLNLSRNATL